VNFKSHLSTRCVWYSTGPYSFHTHTHTHTHIHIYYRDEFWATSPKKKCRKKQVYILTVVTPPYMYDDFWIVSQFELWVISQFQKKSSRHPICVNLNEYVGKYISNNVEMSTSAPSRCSHPHWKTLKSSLKGHLDTYEFHDFISWIYFMNFMNLFHEFHVSGETIRSRSRSDLRYLGLQIYPVFG